MYISLSCLTTLLRVFAVLHGGVMWSGLGNVDFAMLVRCASMSLLFIKGIVWELCFDAIAVGGALYNRHLNGEFAETALSGANVAGGSPEAAYALLELKENVDSMAVTAGALFNQVSNVMSHLGSLNAGYALVVASKMDVDFAGETTELAKGQILAQAGTAMLAQANAQGQGMLALIQS